jgi:hypothetical protein
MTGAYRLRYRADNYLKRAGNWIGAAVRYMLEA